MSHQFNMHTPPFNQLDDNQRMILCDSLDIAYFRKTEYILTPNNESLYLHIIIKGEVEERSVDNHEVFAHYTTDDLFDVRSMFEPNVRHQYIALEDTLSYLLPKAVFLDLYHSNHQFAAYFDNNLARRQALLEANQQQHLSEFILTKVDESVCHPPLILSSDTSFIQATQKLQQHDIDAALVQLEPKDPRRIEHPNVPPYAIVTRTNLLHAVLLDGHSPHEPVARIATFPVLSVEYGEFIFNAMITMTRQKMKRLMVTQGMSAVGMLDMTQILSAFSTHSHVLTLQIERSQTIEALAKAAEHQHRLVENLHHHGIRTRFIMALVSAINEQIIEKAFELTVSEEQRQHCCLLVLGSEGRGEQVLKTDQDNALVLKNGLNWQQFQPAMHAFTHTLVKLGYPLCPGKVMVSNPQWVKSQHEWQKSISQWINRANPESILNLAILTDAHAIAGNRQLFTPVAQHLRNNTYSHTLLLSRFVRPAMQFSTPLTLFGHVSDKEEIDIKRGGIFPIVHGIRTLSLEFAITENNTFERIEALRRERILEPDTADNLSEALKLFFKLRLNQQLAAHKTDNQINTHALGRAERDLLRHSLHVVKKFKQFLRYRYQVMD